VGRDLIDLNTVVGKPHGLFKLSQNESGKKSKVLKIEPVSYVTEMKKELLKDAMSGENNQKIWDDGTAQQLKKEDIEDLRERGLTGSEIVSQVKKKIYSFFYFNYK
jgi:hypothetical protein